MRQKAEKYPGRLRSPRITGRVMVPDGGKIRFPFKKEYGNQRHTIEGLSAENGEDKLDDDIMNRLLLTDEDSKEDLVAKALREDALVNPRRRGESSSSKLEEEHLGLDVDKDLFDFRLGEGYGYS